MSLSWTVIDELDALSRAFRTFLPTELSQLWKAVPKLDAASFYDQTMGAITQSTKKRVFFIKQIPVS